MDLQQEIQTLAAQLGAILADKGLTITTAESCTGGGLSYALTDTPGSSRYLDRAFITYSNSAKTELLGVPEAVLAQHGAVSEQTVIAMAQGAAKAASANIAVAISGVAGPDGGSEEKPVGTVWLAIDFNGFCRAYNPFFTGDRAWIRSQVIEFALEKLVEVING